MELSIYNYSEFTPKTVEPLMNFAQSPVLGTAVQDFPLWHLDSTETSLHHIFSQNIYTVVEFGSFT